MNIYEILAPGGRENAMGEYIKAEAEKMGYNCRFDTFGNLICGEGSVTIECGMDTVSFMKIAEDENGMLKIAVPQKSAVSMLKGRKVQFLNGVVGVVRYNKSEDMEDFDLSVDIGENDKEGAAKAVKTGEFGSVICDMFETEKYVFGNGISSYIPVLVLLEVMKAAKGKAAFVFTTSRKFAGRGLKALLGEYDTKKLVFVGTVKEKDNVKCGGGASVVIKEKGAIPNVSLRQKLIASAEGEIQLLATDENLYLDLPQIYGKGTISGGICIPVRDKDGDYEAVLKADMESAVKLLINYISNGD